MARWKGESRRRRLLCGAISRDEVSVGRHGDGSLLDDITDGGEEARGFVQRKHAHKGIVRLREFALAEEHRNPAVFGEQVVLIAEHAPLAAPEIDLLRQAVWNLHRPAMIPELGIIASGRPIMEDDEVADALLFLD